MIQSTMKFLTLEEVADRAPAVFAENHDGRRSDKYVFVDSRRIIESMEENGWGVKAVKSPKFRKTDPNYGKHELVFQSRDENTAFKDPRIKVINHDGFHLNQAKVFPTIKLINSHNGTTSLKSLAGLMALLCANGLVVARSIIGEFNMPHMRFNPEDAFALINSYRERIPQVMEFIQQMNAKEINSDQQLEYATYARKVRFQNNPNIDPKALLMVRRQEDNGNSVWQVYNRVQENCMKGGFKSNDGEKGRKVRELVAIDAVNKVNEELFEAAMAYTRN